MISHVGILQVWANEHILVIRPMELQRVREDPSDMAQLCWTGPLGGYRPPQFVKERRRDINGIQEEDIIGVCYVNYVLHGDAHHLAWMK